MNPRKSDEAQRQRRRENVGKRLKLCSRCNQRLARHQVKDDRLCCECYVAAGHEPADWHPDCMASAAALSGAAMGGLVLKRAAASRPSGQWRHDDYEVLSEGVLVGRIFLSPAAPQDQQWMWTLAYGYHEDRTPTHGYEATRKAAMAAFTKSWRR